MTLSAALDSLNITEVWTALGGSPLRHGRGRAFWRNGDGYNIAVHEGKGWYDHRDNRGGGVLDLVQVALACEKGAAVEWVAATFGLDIDDKRLTPEQRRRYARAAAEAAALTAWRTEQLRAMRELRDFHVHAFHATLRLILNHGLDYPGADRWADACEQHEGRYEELDTQIDGFEALPTSDLLMLFRRERRAA